MLFIRLGRLKCQTLIILISICAKFVSGELSIEGEGKCLESRHCHCTGTMQLEVATSEKTGKLSNTVCSVSEPLLSVCA